MSAFDQKPTIPRNGSVLLDLTGPASGESPLSSTHNGNEVFRALKAVDRDAVHIVPGDERVDQDQLARLVWSIGEQTYDGLLVVLLPASEFGERLTTRFTTISGWLMVTVEQVNQSAECFLSEFRIEHALGLADRFAERGGKSVILRVREENPSEPTKSSLVGAVSVSKMNVAPVEFADDSLFQTLLAAKFYHFVPVVQEAIKKHINPQYFLEGNGDYALKPIDRYGEWLHQEFETEECAEAALELFENAFGTTAKHAHRAPCLPRSWQIAIGSIRIARQMASWTLEGEAFRCSVLLISPQRYADLISNNNSPQLTRVLNFKEPISFHLGNERNVRNMAELAQADDLFLIVNALDGCLHLIAGTKSRDERSSRHRAYARLAKDSEGLLLHVRDGFVEVYGGKKPRLWLWHDRFHWVVLPFRTLRNILHKHFMSEHDDATLMYEYTDMMIGAIASLMDSHQASIIVLLHDQDIEAFETRTTPLREGFGEPSVPKDENRAPLTIKINELPLETLTSILHIDGAHAVRHNGTLNLKHLARWIKVPQETHSSLFSPSGFTGTGTRASVDLSALLKESCVIKVSASGNMKFFYGSNRYSFDTTNLTI